MMEPQLDGYRISPQQLRIWRLGGDRLQAAGLALVEGRCDLERLHAAVATVVSRHEILRTVFGSLAGMEAPVQRVLAEPGFGWTVEDGRDRAVADVLASLERELGELEPAAIRTGPVLRCRLVRLADDRLALAVALPSLCADAATLERFLAELGAAYAGGAGDAADELLQYADFAEWQVSTTEEPEAELWKRLELPAAQHRLRSGRDLRDRAGEVLAVATALPADVADRLAGLQATHGLDVEAFWFAAWMAFARRNIDDEVVTILRQFSSRAVAPLDTAMGPIDRYLPVFYRPDLDADLPTVATELDAQVTELDAHHLAFDWDLLAGGEGGARAARPLGFSVRQTTEVAAAGLRLSWRWMQAIAEPFEAELEVCTRAPAPGQAPRVEQLVLRVRDHRFDQLGARRLLEGLLAMIRDVLAHPRRPLRQLETLGDDERQLVLAQDEAPACAEEAAPSLCQRLAAVAAAHPERPALVAGEARVSYGALDRQLRRVAAVLRARGVGAEQVVPLVAERSPLAIIGLFGVLAAGGAYAPLDPLAPEPRLRQMLAPLGDGPVLTLACWRELLLRLGVRDARLVLLDQLDQLEPVAELPALEAPAPLSAAYVIYTSGSTGIPKGVVVTHAGLANLAAALQRRVYAGVEPPLRVSLDAPLVFDASIKQLLQLGAGHTLYLVPERARPDGQALLEFVAEHRLEVLDVTPAQLELMLYAGLERRPEAVPARVLIGGEAITAPTWARLRALGAERFYNVYGPTECTDVASVARLSEAASPVLGRPLAAVRAYVLDRAGAPVPVAAPGELVLGGAGVARGYLASPALTAERFVPDPFSGEPGGRLYRTGDRVRRALDGDLAYLGRVDHQIKLRGFRIELGDIETALRSQAGIKDCAVILREDRPGDPRLVAYVLARQPDDAPSVERMHAHARAHLPEYMIPTAFVRLERLPLSRNGKVDRAALPPPPVDEASPLPFLSPVEGILWGIWAQLLGSARLGLDEDFFACGGHSLLATQLVARIREALQVELPLRLIFEAPTLRRLARAVDDARTRARPAGARVEPPRLLPVPRGGDLPLSFAQLRMWLSHQMDPADTSYNAPAAFQVEGRLSAELLEGALSALVQRHEALRTTFAVRGGEPRQVIHAPEPVRLPVEDLAALDEPARAAAVHERLRAHALRPFSLERGPLFRVELIRLAAQRHVVIFDMHHVIRDAWSTAIFVRELIELYRALAANRPAELPELPVQYADFAHWQTSWLCGEVYREHLAYWKRRLAGELPVLELPLDRPRERRTSNTGRRATFAIDGQLAGELRALSQQAGTTLFMTLLAGFLVQLHRYQAQQDLLVGMAIAGRDRVETEHLFGCLVNMLVLRFDLSAAPTFATLLRQVRQVTLEAYEYQAMPFDQLVKELAPPRRPGIAPFFQAAFGLQHAPLGELRVPGLELTPLVSEQEQVRYDLTVWVNERGSEDGGLTVDWTYSDELFEPATIARMARHYETLLRGIAAAPQAAIHTFELRSPQEQLAEAEGQAQKQQALSKRLTASRRKADR